MGYADRAGGLGIVLPDDDEGPELHEPVYVPRVAVTGTYWRRLGDMVAVDGWETYPRRGDIKEHHLCVGKGALTMEAAIDALNQLARLLGKKVV